MAGNQTVALHSTSDGFKFDYSKVQNFQDVKLIRAAVDVSGNNGGNLQVHGRRVSLTQGSEILAHTLGINGIGQGINIRASESVDVVAMNSNTSISTIMASVQPQASGKGGDITIEAPNFRLANGAYLRAELYGKGQSGNVNFKTSNFELVGVDNSGERGAVTAMSVGIFGRGASGSGGTLTIDSERILIANGARLRSDLSGGSGQLGDINIKASDIEIIGVLNEQGIGFLNSWISSTVERNTSGQAGNINIEAQKVRLTDGGSIRLDNLGSGKGGNLENSTKNNAHCHSERSEESRGYAYLRQNYVYIKL